jgi:exodeoxyribonuclease VII large subunit
MSGSIELDRDGRTLRIRFPYDEILVDRVRGLPERRWDRGDKSWKVPARHVEEVVRALIGFEMSGDVTQLLAGTTVPTEEPPKPARATQRTEDGADGDESENSESDVRTVGQLADDVVRALRDAFPGRVKVRGEIVGFEKTKGRKHLFFELVEKDGERVQAKVDVAVFERTAKKILPKLKAAGLELQDGIEILVEAKVDFYRANGRFQLIIEDIDERFTLGKFALDREEILRRLREKGLAERNRSLGLTIPSLRVGVLTSLDSDGWNDFLRTLETSGYAFDVTAGDVRVQGPQLRPTMLAGLEWFAGRSSDFDVLCIVRGGGSRTDLAWFDDEEVANAVATHPIKIVCGIGHERDESVLDVITHSEKTPTAVAHALIDLARLAEDDLRRATEAVCDHVTRTIERADLALRDAAARFRRATDRRLERAESRLLVASRDLQGAVRGLLGRERERLATASARMRLAVSAQGRSERTRLDALAVRLPRLTAVLLARRRAELAGREDRLRLLDPRRVLRRGYALVARADGTIVPDARDLTPDERIQIRLRDGSATADVVSTELDARAPDTDTDGNP